MGKNKDKKANKTSNGLPEIHPYISCVHESPQKLAISTDTDSSAIGSPRRLETLTCSSEKAKKKHKKRHLLSQECEKERSESCSPQAEATLDFADEVDGLTAETSSQEEPTRKKKKKEKWERTEETVTLDVSENDALRKKEKNKRSRDEDEMSFTMKSDESEMMSDEIETGHSGKKKKKDKEKKSHTAILESSALSEQSVHKNGSNDLHEIGVDNEECNVLTEPEENQADNVRVKKKKDKKKNKDKEKINKSEILASEESVQESTGPCEMEDVNVSAEDILGKEKKKKKDKQKQNQIEILESEKNVEEKSSTDPDEMDSVNVTTEPGENQTENILIKKKKEKKSKHIEKQNQTHVLGSATTAAHAVDQMGSTDPHMTEDLEVEPEESPSRKRRKKNGDAHVNGDLKTRETQTVPGRIRPKMEQETNEGSGDDRVQIGTGFGKKTSRQRDPKEVNRRLLEELKQFIPNIESRPPASINKMIQYDLPRYKEFKKKGIPLNHGRFTVKENETLKKNVEDFLALTGIDSGTKLFYTDRFEDEMESLRNLKRNHRFYAAIAEGIPRSCHDVYARGRRVFVSNAHTGQFSKNEIHQLCKLQTLHGNNWKKISELTGRSALSLEKRYSQITKRTGMWSKKEYQRLLRAVRDHIVSEVQPRATNISSIQISRETLYKGLPWRTISEKVKTRSWIKCREKWLSVLPGKMSSETVQTVGASEAKVKLIKAMYQMQVDDIAYVDWDELAALFGDVPPFYVQRKWNKLKINHVPNWQSKCFGDTVDFLYEKVLPVLEKETNYQSDDDITQLKKSHVTSFLLSDIFQDVLDQDSEEEGDDDEDKNEEEQQEKEDDDHEESNMD